MPGNLPSGHILTADELNLGRLGTLANIKTFWSQGGVTLGVTSATYVDVTGFSLSWTKVGSSADTDVGVLLIIGWRPTVAASTGAIFGVNIGGTDTDITGMEPATTTGHYQSAGLRRIPGIGAGLKTVQVRAKRNYGTGTITGDGNDWNIMLVGEILN